VNVKSLRKFQKVWHNSGRHLCHTLWSGLVLLVICWPITGNSTNIGSSDSPSFGGKARLKKDPTILHGRLTDSRQALRRSRYKRSCKVINSTVFDGKWQRQPTKLQQCPSESTEKRRKLDKWTSHSNDGHCLSVCLSLSLSLSRRPAFDFWPGATAASPIPPASMLRSRPSTSCQPQFSAIIQRLVSDLNELRGNRPTKHVEFQE
jgi:hypothetical protein